MTLSPVFIIFIIFIIFSIIGGYVLVVVFNNSLKLRKTRIIEETKDTHTRYFVQYRVLFVWFAYTEDYMGGSLIRTFSSVKDVEEYLENLKTKCRSWKREVVKYN